LTRHFAKLSISPESSDGFASVGTILPKEEAALLPGGLFTFWPKPPKSTLRMLPMGEFSLQAREQESANADELSVGRGVHLLSAKETLDDSYRDCDLALGRHIRLALRGSDDSGSR
jgi:hypothetical protein